MISNVYGKSRKTSWISISYQSVVVVSHEFCSQTATTYFGTPPPFSYIFIMVKNTFKVFLFWFCFVTSRGKLDVSQQWSNWSVHMPHICGQWMQTFLFWKYFRLLSCSMAFRLLPGTETLICHLKAALAITHYQEFRAPRYVDGVTYQRAAEL